MCLRLHGPKKVFLSLKEDRPLNLFGAKLTSWPMDPKSKLSSSEGELLDDPAEYRRLDI